MNSDIKVYFKDSRKMEEVDDSSVHLIVTSPPYFKMRGDMPYKDYNDYLKQMNRCIKEMYRVLIPGRLACIVISDYYENGVHYPVIYDFMRLLFKNKFTFVEQIFWIKPLASKRCVASTRTGAFIQSPYPFNYYPKTLAESILIFQKGSFRFSEIRDKIPNYLKEESKIEISDVNNFLATWWYIQPSSFRVTDSNGNCHSSEFPIEIPLNLIKFYSYVGEVILDCFLGSGTTLLAAKILGRKGIGYEKYKISPGGVNYEEIIGKKLSLNVEDICKHLQKGEIKPLKVTSTAKLDAFFG